jgi:hypothetical protein
MKSGKINFLEPSGPLQACNGTALPLLFLYVVAGNLGVGSDPKWVTVGPLPYVSFVSLVCLPCAELKLDLTSQRKDTVESV